MPVRPERVAAALREEISDALRGLKDPRIGFVSVTEVEVTSDLKQARVHVSILGDSHSKEQTLRGLRAALGRVRTQVARRVRLRYCPEITFHLDESIERGARVLDLMSKLRQEEENGS